MSSGTKYSDLIIAYLLHNFESRGVRVYKEVNLGKTIIGKNRRIDILILSKDNQAFAIECKFQDVKGTTDEKIPYALQNMESIPIPGCVAYAGNGFSSGVLHMLQGSEIASYCLPEIKKLDSNRHTKELDHLLAMNFGWWDLIVSDKKPMEKSDLNLEPENIVFTAK
jgi:hypothetical protein